MVNPRLCETARPLFKNPRPRLKLLYRIRARRLRKLLGRSKRIFRVYGTKTEGDEAR